ncbi:MAG TPA: hypothetical protein VGH38_36515 [Bryobacteraceae bacterium]
MNGSAWIALAALAVTSASAAETRQEKGKRVVMEALQALGGDAYLHMQDRIEFGRAYSFYREQLSGLSIAKIYTRYLAPAPGALGVRERDSFGKVDARSAELKESSAMLFTEEGAWEITYRGARPLEDKRTENYKDSMLRNILYILRQRLKEPGLTFYSQGSDFWENRPVEIVDITDAANNTVTVSFDFSTKLPVRQVFRRRNTEYKDFDTEVTIFAKYRDVGGGVKWPCTVERERNGEKVFSMYADSVEINKNLTDNLFTLPGNVKLLPKAK